MRIRIVSSPAAELRADLIAVPLHEFDPERWKLPARADALDRALGGRLAAALATGDFRAKRGQVLLLYTDGAIPASRVLLIGLGAEASTDSAGLREAAARAVAEARRRKAAHVAILAPAGRRLRAPAVAQALTEGAVLAGYRFDRYKKPVEDQNGNVTSVTVSVERSGDVRAARVAAGQGTQLAECQNFARDLSNEPPNVLPPAALARAAQRMAREVGLSCKVLGVAELRKREMNAMLAVGGGSANPPSLIVLEHNAPPRGRAKKGARKRPTVCLVGKGVTFDSGGLSLKPSASMVTMKHDMSGGAAVIGALRACALLKIPLHVVGIIGAVENMPSGTAYRVDDVLKSMSGKTIEVGNTDAEGRLVLADALHYARTEFEPAAIIDLATLTGAAVVALGNWAAAVLGNNERLSEGIRKAGDAAGERFWPLPLWDVHREHMRGKIADVRQVAGREAGTITAAAFLWHFAGDDIPWAHLDIAPTANTDRPGPMQPFGATGFGVRTLVELLRDWRNVKL